jgi:hypothetical protein
MFAGNFYCDPKSDGFAFNHLSHIEISDMQTAQGTAMVQGSGAVSFLSTSPPFPLLSLAPVEDPHASLRGAEARFFRF